jgi:hypothetical protein
LVEAVNGAAVPVRRAERQAEVVLGAVGFALKWRQALSQLEPLVAVDPDALVPSAEAVEAALRRS